jgi:hypothetical protein
MLETQGRKQNQDYKQGNFREAPLAAYLALAVSALLPKSADVSGSCAGVARNQIARPHAAGNVGALGKVLPLVAGGEDAVVTSGSRRAPSIDFAFFGNYCKCPSGVNELYGSPADVVLSKDVNNPYAMIANLNPGKPKEQHGCGGYQNDARKGLQSCGSAFASQDYHPSESHYDNAHESYGSAGPGSEYLHAKSLACHREVLS